VLRQYADKCSKVIFIDNKGHDLDAVHEALPQVETYHMNRAPDVFDDSEYTRMRYWESRKMAEKETRFEHKCCKTLKDVLL